MFNDYPDVVTPKDLQVMLGIGRNTVYELLRAGIIPSVKIGRQIRISKLAVIEYLSSQNKAKVVENKELSFQSKPCIMDVPKNDRWANSVNTKEAIY